MYCVDPCCGATAGTCLVSPSHATSSPIPTSATPRLVQPSSSSCCLTKCVERPYWCQLRGYWPATTHPVCLRHQFLKRIIPQITPVLAPGCRAISLIKVGCVALTLGTSPLALFLSYCGPAVTGHRLRRQGAGARIRPPSQGLEHRCVGAHGSQRCERGQCGAPAIGSCSSIDATRDLLAGRSR